MLWVHSTWPAPKADDVRWPDGKDTMTEQNTGLVQLVAKEVLPPREGEYCRAWLAGPQSIEAGQLTAFTFWAGVSHEIEVRVQILFLSEKELFPVLPQLVSTTIIPSAKTLPNITDRLSSLKDVTPDATKAAAGIAALANPAAGLVVGAAGAVLVSSLAVITALSKGSASAQNDWEQRTITVPAENWAFGYEWIIKEDLIRTAGNGVVGQAIVIFPFPGDAHVQLRAIGESKPERFAKSDIETLTVVVPPVPPAPPSKK